MKRQSSIIFMNKEELIEGLSALEDVWLYKSVLMSPHFPYLMCKDSGGYTFNYWKSTGAIEAIRSSVFWTDVKDDYNYVADDSRVFGMSEEFNDLLIDDKPEIITDHDKYVEVYCKKFNIPTEKMQEVKEKVYRWLGVAESEPQAVKNLSLIIRDKILYNTTTH